MALLSLASSCDRENSIAPLFSCWSSCLKACRLFYLFLAFWSSSDTWLGWFSFYSLCWTLIGFFHSEFECHLVGLIPGLGRSPGEGKGYPLQYCGLENSMACIVHGVTKSCIWLSNFHFHSSEKFANRCNFFLHLSFSISIYSSLIWIPIIDFGNCSYFHSPSFFLAWCFDDIAQHDDNGC